MQIKSGVDLIKIARIENLIDKESFTKRVFTKKEMEDKRAEHLAGIFAVKEAFFKASQIKLKKWTELEVISNKQGKPQIKFNAKSVPFRILSLDCSLSHDGEYSVAIVVLLTS